ncbi:MAG: hypothetical protein WC459_00315 [Patescibacteria group bacterium]
MNLLVHASAGAIVAQYTGNPIIALLYGVLSHIVLDMIPHGDSKLYVKYKNKELSLKKAAAKTILDSIAAIILTVVFFNLPLPASNLVLSMAIIGSILPDVLIGLFELFDPNAPKWLKIIHKWHFKNHDLIAKKYDLSIKNGLLLQIIVFLVLIRTIF